MMQVSKTIKMMVLAAFLMASAGGTAVVEAAPADHGNHGRPEVHRQAPPPPPRYRESHHDNNTTTALVVGALIGAAIAENT
ncbi:hypothetical protein [Megasphaera vaginalis (ex Srinivasan et al. 2021)]|uniref:Glycine zipper 2TM domain-containing protein n=1 Tax=Megasphaera vaginalis (ex Srinivasan et al. 2021) TaxID=1111454 RepID=U7UTI6_9FIRM|nr:hypothetical protein [Megasphaera vaginalis (ex Srinivasan et al. 2021)]ERT62747.1 hypothetical protein HMPREF1250_0123 [Megasphaera vaginalis (ex Srinivasan et al. 2021)]